MLPLDATHETTTELAVGEVARTSVGGFGIHGDQTTRPAIRTATTTPASEASLARRLMRRIRGGSGAGPPTTQAGRPSNGAAETDSMASRPLAPPAASAGTGSMSSAAMREATPSLVSRRHRR